MGKSTDSMKAHISAETSRLEDTVTTESGKTLKRIQKLEGMISDSQQEQILKSLKYPTMNERRNQISAYSETCEWIFSDDSEQVSSMTLFTIMLPHSSRVNIYLSGY
jgi:hypothetical protein